MLETPQIISLVLIFSPLIAALASLTPVFDVSYKDAKKKFDEIGQSLRDRKIINWRRVFEGGQGEDGNNVALNDDYIANVLRNMEEGEGIQKFLKRCRKVFQFYYAVLLLIFFAGFVHWLFNFMNWTPEIIANIANYQVLLIIGTIAYIVIGMTILFVIKEMLESKHNNYHERY